MIMDTPQPAMIQEQKTGIPYSEVYRRVKAGEEIYVTFGLYQIPLWAPAKTLWSFDTVKGFENGVYRCFLIDGVPKMQQVFEPQCANGVCPLRR